MSSPFPTGLTSASHAGRIAWVFNAKGARNVWVADAPDFAARQVTHYAADDGQDIASLGLTPDGHTVVYARGSELNRQGEVANPQSWVTPARQQVWAMDVDGGVEPRLLGLMECTREGCEDVELSPDGRTAAWAARGQIWTAPVSGSSQAQQLTYVRGENASPRWSPDGTRIAFVSSRGDHGFIAIYDFERQSLSYLAPTVDRDSMPRWSPDGKQIAFIRTNGTQQKEPMIPVRPTPWGIWVADADTGAGRQVWHSADDANGSLPRMTAEVSFHFAAGNRITFSSEMDGRAHLYSVAVSGGQPTLLTPGEFDIENVTLAPDGKSLLYSSNQDDVDRRHIWRVPVEGGKPVALTHGETIEWAPIETFDGKYQFCLGSSATSPAMPYRITASGREMLAKQAMPADFPSAADLVTPQQVIFKAADGLEIHGQLFVPNGRTAPGPALVFMHGGPPRQMMLGWHNMGYYHNAYSENQYLASQGYVVLSVNYRLGIQYGRAFREPEHGGWRGASEYQDIVAGAKYLQSLSYVDAKKIGLWGGSYGGFLTAMGLARNSDIFAAGVDMHGVHDWSARMNRFGGGGGAAPDQREAMQLAWQSSPDSSISTWKSPVLLIQGDDDRNVDFTQTVDLAQRLRAQHVPFEQLVFPDEIHDFLMWKSWVRAYRAGAEFFDRALKKGETIGGSN